MTKILMYSVRDDEQPAIQEYAAAHNLTIDTNDVVLHGDTVQLAQGYDGIVIQQRGPIGDDTVYTQLASYGIHQLTTRTAGVDTINLDAAAAAGLTVTNVPAYSPRSVAEHALMSIFRILRQSPLIDARVRNNNFDFNGLQAKEIHSTTIGIIGAGRIGGTLAQMLHLLGAKVLAYDVQERDDLRDIVTYTTKAKVLEQSDVVSLHVDLNPTSTGLIGADDLKLMQPTSGLVNASRGPVVDTAALITALKNHELAMAALDTVEGEAAVFTRDLSKVGLDATPQIKELNAMANVILTPHIGFYTNIAVQNMVDIALDDVLAVLNGEQPKNAISR